MRKFLAVLSILLLTVSAFASADDLVKTLRNLANKEGTEVQYLDQPVVSVTLVNRPLGEVLVNLAKQTGYSFRTSTGVDLNRKVTVVADNLPLGKVLNMVAGELGYVAVVKGDEFYVSDLVRVSYKLPPEVFEGERVSYTVGGKVKTKAEETAAAGTTGGESQSTITGVFSGEKQQEGRRQFLYFRRAVEALLSKDGTLSLDPTTGIMCVVDHPRYVKRVEDFVDRWNSEYKKQVFVEAAMVEVVFEGTNALGIDWSAVKRELVRIGSTVAGYSITSTLSNVVTSTPVLVANIAATTAGTNRNPFEAVVKVLERQGKVKLLSQPKLLLYNHQVGNISAVVSVPYISSIEKNYTGENFASYTYSVSRVNEGVSFAVTPHIYPDGKTLTLTVYPTYSTIKEWKKFKLEDVELEDPVVTIRQTYTKFTLHDGDFVVIGGAQTTQNRKASVKVPLLGDVPVLGWAFRSSEKIAYKGEIVIMLHAKVVNTGFSLQKIEEKPEI